MKTSQSAYSNTDGSTHFYNYSSSATKLTCEDMVGYNIDDLDGTYGRKLFYEARGYSVSQCFNQNTDNKVTGGFSFADFKAEIDAGHPVLLNLAGHSIVGMGYDASTNAVYIHDTWGNYTTTMTWGGSYSGMELLSVSVVDLASIVTVPTLIAPTGTITTSTPSYQWTPISGGTSYQVQVFLGTTTVVDATVPASSVCSGNTCSYQPSTTLANGDYTWKVRGYTDTWQDSHRWFFLCCQTSLNIKGSGAHWRYSFTISEFPVDS
jgi:hypothetical protein